MIFDKIYNIFIEYFPFDFSLKNLWKAFSISYRDLDLVSVIPV